MKNLEAETRKKAQRDALIARLPTRSPIYLPTQKVPLDAQINGLKKVLSVYEHDLDKIYRPRLRALREHFKGKKRCFIIGNGPSLNRTDLSMLKDETCIAVNGFFLKMPELDWSPTFYLVEDHLVAEDRAREINELQGSVKLFPAYLAYCLDAADNTIFFNHRPRKSYPHGFDFSADAAQITYTGCTVTFTALQLASYLGFEHIYLVGVDADYDVPQDAVAKDTYGTGVLDMRSDDPNHFHPDYFGKGYRWHDPQVDKMIEAYEEAERVSRQLGKTRIFNATKGGRLEVFERVPYDDLFASSGDMATADETRTEPKVLLIDMTRCGGGTATGELKATYFGNWPDGRFMHVYSAGRKGLRIDRGGVADQQTYAADKLAVYTQCEQFAPDVVIYRPVADKPDLHAFAMRAIARLDKPHVIWMMDDWPRRLRDQNADLAETIEQDLRLLCTRAADCWAISQAMAGAFGARYGAGFKAFRNTVHMAEWRMPKTPDKPGRDIVLRYAGGLAPDMALQSVRDAAKAIALARDEGVPLRLEILSQQHWLDQYSHFFADQPHVSVAPATLSSQDYRHWIMEADILLIAYNFDPDTLKYVRYSFANKTPECLASGNAVLAYGPAGIETLDFLEQTDAALRVSRPGPDQLTTALVELTKNAKVRRQWSKKAQKVARNYFNQEDQIAAFKNAIFYAAQKKAGGLPDKPIPKPAPKLMPKPEKYERPASSSHWTRLLRFAINWKSMVAVLAAILLGGALWLATPGLDRTVRMAVSTAAFVSPMMLWALLVHIVVHQNHALEKLSRELENLRRRQGR